MLTDQNFFPKETRFIGALVFLALVSGYYLYNKRYLKIYDAFKRKEAEPIKTWKAILIIVTYYLISCGVLLLAGLYKNKDWIFRD